MADIKVISMNCRGLADPVKRRDVLNHLREKKPSIVFLQDIHLDNTNSKQIILEWGFEGLIAPFSRRSRGVAILFNNNFEYKIHSSILDPNCTRGSFNRRRKTQSREYIRSES